MSYDKITVEQALLKRGFESFKWFSPKDIIVGRWVRFKCMFGCASFNTRASCPPNVPSVEECRNFFNEYENGLIIHISGKLEDPQVRGEWSRKINNELVKVEREVFLLGNRKAFILTMDECQICKECAVLREECKNKMLSRPSVESLGVDVFETVRRQGFPIEVLKDYSDTMNRYAILLVE